VTCLTPQGCRPAAADPVGEPATVPPARARASTGTGTVTALLAYLRTDAAFPQFVRFVVVGGSSTAFYALLFLGLGGLGYMPAHVIATIASSVLANELHRRLTFRAEERVHFLTAQIEAGAVSVIGLVATSAALAWLAATAAGAPAAVQIGLVATVTAVIGLLRFVALRWIFRPSAVEA
jgi:putative flippase GtrA